MKDNEITESTFAFRVSKKDKDWLKKELAALKKIANSERPKGIRVINKNDLILEALRVGFDRVRKNYGKGKS